MKKLTLLFAFLCASVMGLRAAASYSGNIAGELNSYTYDINYVITYNDNHTLTFTADFTGTFSETEGLVFEVWSTDLTGNFRSFSKGSGNTWTATDTKDFESMEGQALSQLRLRIASQAGGTDQLFISNYTVGLDNNGGGDEPGTGGGEEQEPGGGTETSGINWDEVSAFTSASKYKIAIPSGGSGYNNSPNIEPHNNHQSVYVTFPVAIYSIALPDGTYEYLGAGAWLYLDAFEEGETKVEVTDANSTKYTFYMWYEGINLNEPHPSGKGFGTYIAKNVPFYPRVDSKADDTQAAYGTTDLYIVTFGNKILAKAKLNGALTYGGNAYSMQFRVWDDAQTGFAEQWAELHLENATVACIDLNSNRSNLNQGTRTVLPMNTYMETSAGTGAVPMFMYTLDYINAPIEGDVTAPVISNTEVSYSPITGAPTITITATDANDIFYKVVAPDNSVSYSFSNIISLVSDGSNENRTYNCYAIDYNGNISDEAAVVVQMKPVYSNLAYQKTVTAGVNQGTAGQIVDGNWGEPRWSSVDAIHYDATTHPDDYQDWFYINFVNVCDLSAVRIKWETARPDYYTFRTSMDGVNWTTVKTFTEYPDNNVVVDYILPANTQGRYFGVWATSGFSSLLYGMSPFEVEVYGAQATDPAAPTNLAVTATGVSATAIELQMSATDNFAGTITYLISRSGASNIEVEGASGAMVTHTVTGLTAGNNYTFSVVAKDEANNTSAPVERTASPVADTQAPTDLDASVTTFDYNSATLRLSATDNTGGTITYHITANGANEKTTTGASGVEINYVFEGLGYNTDYVFSVVAKDASENTSAAVNLAEITTPYPPYPITEPAVPSHDADGVISFYSDSYSTRKAADISEYAAWHDGTGSYTLNNVNGNNYILYTGYTKAIWNFNNRVAAFVNSTDDTKHGFDLSDMEHMHVDVWANKSGTMYIAPIYTQDDHGNNEDYRVTVNVAANQWTSFDFNLASDFGPANRAHDFSSIYYIRLGLTEPSDLIVAVDNLYFWKNVSTTKTVSATVSPASTGSVLITAGDPAVEVDEVASGTEVTFTATPAEGYEFVGWYRGGTKLSEEIEYAVTIMNDESLEARFETERPIYCHELLTADNNNRQVYLTIKNMNQTYDNKPVYRIEFEGVADNAITGIANFNVAVNHATALGEGWTVETTENYPLGHIYRDYAAADWRNISFSAYHFNFTAATQGFYVENNFPTYVNWANTCADENAPDMDAPVADPLSATSVRLTLSATDDYSSVIWYHIVCDAASIDETITGMSGETITKDYTELTTGTLYEFVITAADGSNPSTAHVCDAQSCSATPAGDTEAPVIAEFTATASYGYIDLAITATDDMAGELSYTITYGSEEVNCVGAAGEEVTKRIYVLPNTSCSFSVIATDAASHVSDAAVANATTMTIPAASVPTTNASLVRSVYSDAYSPAVAQSFWRSNYGSPAPIAENDYITYRMTGNVVVWGHNSGSAGAGNIDAINDEYSYGENTGLDVTNMSYIHFDIWCDQNNQLNTVNINDQSISIPTTRTVAGQWVSFDVAIGNVPLADRQNVRFLNFHPFNSTNCLVAIDNVYFWTPGAQTTPQYGDEATGGWATFSAAGKVAVPEGLTAYKAVYEKNGNEEILNLTNIGSVIPANAGVLLRGEPNHLYSFTLTNDAEPDMSGNMLVGCPVRTDISAELESNDIFCLRYSEMFSMTGFFLYTNQYVPAGKAYLALPKDPGIPAGAPRNIRFVIDETNTATGLTNTDTNAIEAVKFIQNGQLFIRRGNSIYTIQGTRVQ